MISIFNKRLIINIGITLAIIVAFGVVIFVMSGSISQASSEISTKSSQLASGLAGKTDLNRLRAEADAAAPDIAKLNTAILKRESLYTFPAAIKSLAVKNNLASTFHFNTELGAVNGFNKIPFETGLQGDYSSMSNFLKDLEASGYLINVTDINITGQADKYGGTIDGTLVFKE